MGHPRTYNIASYLEEMAEREPHRLAVVYPEGRDRCGRVSYTHYTFRQLHQVSDRMAQALESAGIGCRSGVRHAGPTGCGAGCRPGGRGRRDDPFLLQRGVQAAVQAAAEAPACTERGKRECSTAPLSAVLCPNR